jgi:hypothetical protein
MERKKKQRTGKKWLAYIYKGLLVYSVKSLGKKKLNRNMGEGKYLRVVLPQKRSGNGRQTLALLQ